ncbi:MAG: Do family serine endopeptidase [Gammaproteobacteria bacterium]|nr:Do family serine endopeptidase [Gammaproteobacteria bacterium]
MFVIKKIVLGSLFVLLSALSFDSASRTSLPDFTSLVTDASPAVVNITAIRKAPDSLENNQEEVPEMLRRFFRDYQQRGTPRPATGSGFLISSDGYVLTNHHVVQGASEIIVALSDRREREAELIGADPVSDLALLKIDAVDLPVVSIGSSESLKVGEWVMAIGSPFGFELSVTAGIVSAKGRSLPDDLGNYVPFIQTDVAINPGNSGGPLFNLDGKVVGINSQIFTRSGGFMGLSFAIPIDVAMEVVAQLKDKGSVSRGWLGVQIQRVDRDLAESFGLDRAAGALVTRVFADSPAAAAGVREGDIIVEFGGRGIDLSSDLPHVVGRFKAGSETHLMVERAGESVKLAVKVGELDADDTSLASTDARAGPTRNRLGLEVRAMSAEEKVALDAAQGVLVIKVGEGPGALANLNVGDVITTINSQWVDSVTEFNTVMATLPVGVALPVRIIRSKQPQFIAIKIDS